MERNTMTIAKETVRTMVIAIALTTIVVLALFQASMFGARKVESYERQQNEIQIGTAVHIERDTYNEWDGVTITEDMPEWDCETMGNLICGTDK